MLENILILEDGFGTGNLLNIDLENEILYNKMHFYRNYADKVREKREKT